MFFFLCCDWSADLIMLGLATHEPNFTIIREEFKPNKPRPCALCGQLGHEIKDCQGTAREKQGQVRSTNSSYFNLSIFKDSFQHEGFLVVITDQCCILNHKIISLFMKKGAICKTWLFSSLSARWICRHDAGVWAGVHIYQAQCVTRGWSNVFMLLNLVLFMYVCI